MYLKVNHRTVTQHEVILLKSLQSSLDYTSADYPKSQSPDCPDERILTFVDPSIYWSSLKKLYRYPDEKLHPDQTKAVNLHSLVPHPSPKSFMLHQSSMFFPEKDSMLKNWLSNNLLGKTVFLQYLCPFFYAKVLRSLMRLHEVYTAR